MGKDAAAELARVVPPALAKRMASMAESKRTMRQIVDAVHRSEQKRVHSLLRDVERTAGRTGVVVALAAIVGAGDVRTPCEPIWTIPGDLTLSGRHTANWAKYVNEAESSVTCSTYNFQKSSALWVELQQAGKRLHDRLNVYVDTAASLNGGLDVTELQKAIAPGLVWQTRELPEGQKTRYQSHYRSHAKFLIIDHRCVIVTSANFSKSAEHNNIELGVVIEDPRLAETIEHQLITLQGKVYKSATE